MQLLPFRRTGCGLFLIALLFSCQKQHEKASARALASEILSARNFFSNSIASSRFQAPNVDNFRARLLKTIRWDLAQTTTLSGQPTVVAPVQFVGHVYISSDLARGIAFELGSLTRLLIARDSNNAFHYGLLTYIPDSSAINTQSYNSGLILYEDWQGNSLSVPQRISRASTNPPNSSNKQIDVVQTIQVCNEIDGYNYAPDDPAGGVTNWSENTCNTYTLPTQSRGPTVGPGSLPGLLGPKPVPLTIQLAPPGNPIGNIADYFKCFTPGDGGGHQFTVTLAVEQPVMGSRQPWTLTQGGVSGSSAAGNPFSVGHTWLIFSENTGYTTTTRNVGFYPQNFISPLNPSAQGILGDDEGADYDIALTVTVSSNQFYEMLAYVSQGNNSGYLYNLNNNNCSTFALDALAAGGESITSNLGTWAPNGQGFDPGDLGEDIRNMSLSSNMTRSTVSNYHPNLGSCN